MSEIMGQAPGILSLIGEFNPVECRSICGLIGNSNDHS
jgi:hypothetical protein